MPGQVCTPILSSLHNFLASKPTKVNGYETGKWADLEEPENLPPTGRHLAARLAAILGQDGLVVGGVERRHYQPTAGPPAQQAQ